MQQINFTVGNKKRFAEFISSLNEKEKIALVSHTDLDGIAAAIVTNKVINADLIKFVDYTDLNDNLIEELKNEKVKKLIITDLSFNSPEFIKKAEKHFEILIIDHHQFPKDFNSDKTVFMNTSEHCATYLAYTLFSDIQNLEELDWLVALANISDWAYFNCEEFMSKTLKKYGDKYEMKGEIIRKSGKFWDLQWTLNLSIILHKGNLHSVFDSIGNKFGDIGNLKEGADKVQKEIDDALEKFDREKEKFKDGYFWEYSPKFRIGSVLSTLISSKNPNKTFVVGRPEEKIYYLSARRQDKKVNSSHLLQKLITGFENSDAGGHIAAAGGHFPIKYLEEFKKRLKSL